MEASDVELKVSEYFQKLDDSDITDHESDAEWCGDMVI